MIENLLEGDIYFVGTPIIKGMCTEKIKKLLENPEDKNLQVSLQNFEQAKTHPDTEDKNNLIKRIKTDLDIK